VKQKLLTIPQHLSSYPVFSEVHVVHFLVFCVVFYTSLNCLSIFLLVIVLPVLLRYMASDYSCGIIKLQTPML